MNLRILHIVILLCITFPIAASGQGDTTRTDSAKTYRGPEIVVEASSVAPRIARSAQPLAIIGRGQIEAANAVDLADVVAFSPGVFVRRYGGLGGLQTVSLRGTSSQQPTLFVDGVRYQSSASGGFDLGNIPAASIERVEVLRGGNAALFGANALGGIINVVMRASGDGRVRSEARGTAGSFGERSIGASISGGELHRWDLSLQSTSATGRYPFNFNEYGTTSVIRRDNADFSSLFGRAALSSKIGDVRLSLSGQAFQSERGVPGAVVQGNHERLRARLDERELFSTARVSYAPSEWSGAVTLSGRLNRMNYRDPDARLTGSEGIDNRYDRREGSAVLRVGRLIESYGSIDATVELSYADLSGDNIDPSAGALVRRIQTAGAVLTNWFVSDILSGIHLSIDGGLRFDSFSDLDPALSPSIGVVLHPAESPFRLRAHGALNYRAPSFSEQYYLNFGNIDLRPERSRSFDVGATYELASDFALESTLFLIDTRDQIVAVPRSPVSWSAMNIGRVLSRGLELSASGRLFEGLIDLHATYTLIRAEDRSGGETEGMMLVYSPGELANGIATLHIGDYSLSSSWQYVSHRHTLPLNPPESALPHYVLIGATVAGQWKIAPLHLMAQLEAVNLFDTDYQVVRNYPMPGRMFRIGVTMRYGDDEN